MKCIDLSIHICGLNSETITNKIMIFKPKFSIKISINEEELSSNHIENISDYLKYIMASYSRIITAAIGNSKLCISKLRFRYDDYMLGLLNDKPLAKLFDYINSEVIEFEVFFCGGASIHCERNYKFIIHPNEEIHKHTPHVHVEKDRKSIRYSLTTLEPMDKLDYPHIRDNKKIIIPALKKHKQKLMDLWNHYQHGYSLPVISDNGDQYYPES